MIRTYCDRCGTESGVYKTTNPLAREGLMEYYEQVQEPHYPEDITARYSDDDGGFIFSPELCQSCRVELARTLIAFMEAHKS